MNRACSRLLGCFCGALLMAGCGERVAPAPELVVLVTIDTLRADHLEVYGYPRRTAPFLATLAERGTVFERVIASSSHTAPSHASLFTGLYPSQHGVVENGRRMNEATISVASIFRRNGYLTSAFTAVQFLQGLDVGFDHFFAKQHVSARTVFDSAREWILSQEPDTKQFVWVHLYDVHDWRARARSGRIHVWDGEPAEHALAVEELLFSKPGVAETYDAPREEILRAVTAYDAAIRGVDAGLRGFFDGLSAAGRNSSALWVVTSDHGEALGAHGAFMHAGQIYNQQLRVPLVVYTTDQRYPPANIAALVRHVDVGVFLADLVGDSFNQQVVATQGQSFLPLIHGDKRAFSAEVAFSQRPEYSPGPRLRRRKSPASYALQGPRYKLISHDDGAREFFDLTEDPHETRNLVGSGLREEARFERELRILKDRFEADGRLLEGGEIDPEHLEELKALGYL